MGISGGDIDETGEEIVFEPLDVPAPADIPAAPALPERQPVPA